MSNAIDLELKTSGEDGINRIVTAIDRLHSGLEKLGNVSGLSRIEQQMAAMQASMTTGFKLLENQSKESGAKVVAGHEETSKKVLSIEQRRDVELNKMRQQDLANRTAWWGKILDMQERRDAEMNAASARAASEYVSWWSKAAAERVAIEQKRDIEMHGLRAKEYADYASWWTKTLATQETEQRKQLALDERQAAARAALATSATERQRSLNTGYLTASPASQVLIAQKAKVYGGMGGDAAAKYGSEAAGVNALAQAHARLAQVIPNTTRATNDHNQTMRDAHGLARGLAGSLGGLWLTYGSVIPLLAGAAIASSLKQIVVVGKEVENQLNFVAALTKEEVNLDKFLAVTDSSLRSITESANAMRMLAQNGLSAQEALRTLPAILDLATVGEMTVGQAALAATGATSAFGLQISEAGRVADIFAKTAAESNTSVVAITESMKQASTVASLFKVTIEETAGMLGLLAKINITGGAAGTSMTNMLTGLYEPTEKGKRALAELGVETKTASGQLKPFTLLLEEMKGALSGFNDSARVDILGSIFTIRGVKSAELALQNIDSFKQKAEEARTAAGFMRGVVTQLEDSTTGAFSRLGVVVQNTLIKSFAESSPYIQKVGLDLAHAFGSKEAESGMTNLSTNIARLTGSLIENAGGVATVAVGFLGYRAAAAALTPVVLAATTASTASAVATAAAAAASATFNAAQVAGTATTLMYATALEAQAGATLAATTASRAWAAVVLPALGVLAVALAGAAALWLLFRDNTDEADRANTKIGNSLRVVNEGLDREIERLEKANDLWDKHNGRFKTGGGPSATTVEKARETVAEIEGKVTASGGTVKGAMGPQTIQLPSGITARTAGWNQYSAALKEARANLAALEVAEGEFNTVVKPGLNAENARKALEQAKANAEKFAKGASAISSKGELYQQNDDVRDIYRKGGGIVNELNTLNAQVATGKLNDTELKTVLGRIDQAEVDLKLLGDQASKLLSDRALKPDRKGAASKLAASREEGNEEIRRLEGILQLQKQSSAFEISQAQMGNNRGEIGDLELINRELEQKLALDKSALEIARLQAAVPDISGARQRGFKNKEEQAGQQALNDVAAAKSKQQGVLAAMAEEERAYAADTMREKGQYVDAYLSDFESKYGSTISRVEKDLEESRGGAEAAALASYLEFMAKLKNAGAGSALSEQLGNQFNLVLDQLSAKLDDINSRSGPGTGLAEMFTNALAAEQAYAAALPQLTGLQRSLEKQAETGGPKEKAGALDALAKMKQQATAMRGIWIGVADQIGDALTRAFGRAGTALGGLIKTTAVYGAKRKQIDEDYKKASSGTDAQRATAAAKAYDDTTGAQVNMYAEVAGAAKGFFSEGSKGYIALGAAEKAFRVISLGMAIQDAVTKSGLITTLTGLFVTGETVKAGAASTGALATIAAFLGIGQAAAVTGVATQAIGEPTTAWARMAAMAVAMGALGFMVAGGGRGGGGGKTAEQVQKVQGTGSFYDAKGLNTSDLTGGVFGDSTKQSQSISKSLDMMEKNSDRLIPINTGMLSALRSIEASMTGLANLVVRSPGVMNGTNMGIQEGRIKGGNTGAGALLGAASGFAGGSSMMLIGSVMGPIGAAIGAVLGAVVGKLWGKTDQKIVDSGIQFGGSVRGLQAGQGFSQYASVDKTKSSWFGLSKNTTNSQQTQALSNDLTSQLGLVFTDVEKALTAAAVSLGAPAGGVASALDALVIDTTSLSLKGLKGDELTQAINAVISKATDQMSAAAFPGLDAFRQVGEGYTETVMRLANNYGILDAAMRSIGGSFGAVGMGSLAARERLIAMSGGIDKFDEQAKTFAEGFMTKAERLAPVQKHVTEELGRLGQAGLKTREDFKGAVLGLVNSGALATESGAKTYTGLMALQKAFMETTPEIKDLTKSISEITSETEDLRDQLDELTMTRIQLIAKERAALDPSNRAMFDQIQGMKKVVEAKERLNDAYEDEKKKIEETVDRLQDLAKNWKKFREDLKLGDKSPLTPVEKYKEARLQYDTTLAAAKGGDKDAQARYEDVANNFLEASRRVNSSSDFYTADFNDVMQATAEAITWAEQQVNVAKESLKALERQVGQLTDIKLAILSVTEAIKALDLAKGATPEGKITDLYRTLLKREPDAPGLKYWQDIMAKGSSVNDIAATIKTSDEYNGRAPQPAPGNQAAQDAQQASAPAGATAEQMAALLAEIAAMRAEAQQNTGATIDAAYNSTADAAATVQEAVEQSTRATKWDRDNKANIE